MKKFLIALLCALALPVLSAAQTPKISLNVSGESLKSVIEKLEVQSGYSFFYDQSTIDTSVKVSVKLTGADLKDALAAVFKGLPVEYKIVDGNILLKAASSAADSKAILFRGNVIDEENAPVTGAMVVSLKNRSSYSVTDLDGNFTVRAAEGEAFEVSCLGFTSERCKASSKAATIQLSTDHQLLDEVVVVGYGTQKRSDITGSISTVKPDEMTKIPTSSIAEMLRGAAAGVQVNTSNAAPGESSSVLIRGRRSLSGGNSPIYIVDGVPMSSIDDISAGEIESLEILKDAASQSIYGARASNGVILVTTKRGIEGATTVSYNGSVNVQQAVRNFELFSGEEYAAYREEAWRNAKGSYDYEACFSPIMREVLENKEFINWEALMIHPAVNHKHEVLVQSGTKNTKLAIGLGGLFQHGMIDGYGFKKVNGRINIDHKFTSWLSMGANIMYAYSWKDRTDGSFNKIISACPIGKIYNDDGTLKRDIAENGETTNPLFDNNNYWNKTTSSRLVTTVFANVKFSPLFSYKLNASMSQKHNQEGSYMGLEHSSGRVNKGKAYVGKNTTGEYLVENIFNYNQDIGADHHVDATLMQSITISSYTALSATGTGFENDDLIYNGLSSATSFGTPSFGISERHIVSFLARARYNYRQRYLFTAALRVDGSSVFGANNKWGYFPSVSGAWRMSEEPWMKPAKKVLSNLKLRVSWGQVGNQAIDPYQTLGLADRRTMEFGDVVVNGYLPNEIMTNPNLKWETSTTTNLGIDFGLFKGRIGGTLELYYTKTTDLLVSKALSYTTGYARMLTNIGAVQNRGVELTLNTIPIKKGDFEWGVNFMFYTNENKILDIDGTGKDDVTNKWFIGKPMNVYYDYAFDGIWQEDDDIAGSHMPTCKPGDIRLKDIDGDGKITTDDRIIYKRDPDWISSLSTTFSWKGIDVGMDFYYSHGGYMSNSWLTDGSGSLIAHSNGVKREYWTPENKSQTCPAPNFDQQPAYITVLGKQKASFFRIRNAQIGYSFPKKLLAPIKAKALRIYATGTNLWYKSAVLGYGPEATPGDFPEARTFLLGLKITF